MNSNNPANVEYWKTAKKFVAEEPRMAEQYAEVAGIDVNLFDHLMPSELCDKYNRISNQMRQRMRCPTQE